MPFGMPYGAAQQSVVDTSHMQHGQHEDLISMGNPNAQAGLGLGGAGAGPLPPPAYHQLTPEQQQQSQQQHYAANGAGGNGGPGNSATPTPDSQYYSSYCDTRGRWSAVFSLISFVGTFSFT